MRIIENPIFGAYLYGASYDSETKKVTIRVPKPFFFFFVTPFTIKGKSVSKDGDNIIFHYSPKRNVVIICSNGKKKKLYRGREYSIMVNPQTLREATITDLNHLKQTLPR